MNCISKIFLNTKPMSALNFNPKTLLMRLSRHSFQCHESCQVEPSTHSIFLLLSANPSMSDDKVIDLAAILSPKKVIKIKYLRIVSINTQFIG